MPGSKNSKNSRRSSGLAPGQLPSPCLCWLLQRGRDGGGDRVLLPVRQHALFRRCRSASRYRAPHCRFPDAGLVAGRHHVAAAAASADDSAGAQRLAVAHGPGGRDRCRASAMSLAAAFLFAAVRRIFASTGGRGRCGGRVPAESEHALSRLRSDDGARILRGAVRAALLHGAVSRDAGLGRAAGRRACAASRAP